MTKIKLLINFAPLKTGGGQNVALNFLYGLNEEQFNEFDILFLVAKNSQVHYYLLNQERYLFFVAPVNPIFRIVYERFWLSNIFMKNGIEIIYSYFGFGFFGKSFKQICGSADSNIFYPEINFWRDYSKVRQFKFFIVDAYKKWWIQKANAVVFENSALMIRGRKLFQLKKSTTIRPSIVCSTELCQYNFPSHVPNVRPRILLLCGWQLNKGIMLVPEIAAELKRKNLKFQFIITAPIDNSRLFKKFVKNVKTKNVIDYVYVIGQVEKSYISDLYKKVDFVLLLSKLESFSNNIIEAWTYKVPIIIAREEWAISICKEAAIYVNRESPSEIADKLAEVFFNEKEVLIAQSNAKKELEHYPDISQRIKEELNYVKEIAKSN